MTEIRVIKSEAPSIFDPPVDVLYLTQYRYDEAGNRVRKIRYKYTGSTPDPVFDMSGDAPPWTLQSDEFYVRDVSGKEISIYSGSTLTQWNIWGLDNVGKINADTTRNYYLKDHLGSIRVVLNSTNTVVSAQDYDAWGYQLENRSYNSTAMKYDFTGKERDNETSYDYFGARYYDSRIGRWGQVDPMTAKYLSWNPYNYSLTNPISLLDENGLDVIISGDDRFRVFNSIKREFKDINFTYEVIDDNSIKLLYNGDASDNQLLLLLQNAIDNPFKIVNLITGDEVIGEDVLGEKGFIPVGLFGGSLKKGNKTYAIQYFNYKHSKVWKKLGGSNSGWSALHEIVEAYLAAYFEPGSKPNDVKNKYHNKVVKMEPAGMYYPEMNPVMKLNDYGEAYFDHYQLIGKNGEREILFTKDDF